MSHLGSFGAAVREMGGSTEKDTFEFYGETFKVVGEIPPILMVQLGAAATGKIDEQEGLAALWEALRSSLDDEADATRFQAFYKLAVNKRCDLEELMKVVMALFEAQAGRPTGGPSGSSPGSSAISPSSSVSSSATPASPYPGMTSVAQAYGLGGSGDSRAA